MFKMKYICGLMLLIFYASACPSREATIRCFYNQADSNGDNIVSREELSKKVYSALHWYESVPFKVFGGINRIMADCDIDRDGTLSVHESLRATKCMDTCFKRIHTKNKFNC